MKPVRLLPLTGFAVAALAALVPGCSRLREGRERARQGAPEAEVTTEHAAEAEEIARRAAEFAGYEPKPLPCGSDARTEQEFAKVRLAFHRKWSVQAYRKTGSRDPAWDTQAEALLSAYASRNAEVPEAPSDEEFAKLADAALKAGCDDPLVETVAGIAFYEVSQLDRARDLVFSLHAAPTELEYPDLLVWPADATGHHVFRLLEDDQFPQAKAARDMVVADLGIGLQDFPVEGAETRALYHWIAPAIEGMTAANRENLLERLEEIDELVEKGASGVNPLDPWLRNMLWGECEVKLAWEARSDRVAAEVTDEGWSELAGHLSHAREHLVAAREAQPDWPEAPARMISVVMAERGGTAGEMRMWFDRAVAAQFDYSLAYNRLLWGLRPRWGGSHEAMWEVAKECLATKRFDTRVPLQMLEAALAMGEDDGALGFWRQPGVYEDIERLCQGYLAETKAPINRDHLRTTWAAVAWRAGKYQRAAQLLDELGDEVVKTALVQSFATPLETIRNEIAVFTGPHVSAIAEADAAAKAGDLDKALASYRSVRAATRSQATRAYVGRRIAAIEAERAIERGETYDLLANTDLSECRALNGRWERGQDGSLVLYREGPGGGLLFPPDVKDNYEMTADIEFPCDDDRLTAGIIFSFPDPFARFGTGYEKVTVDRYAHLVHAEGNRLGAQPKSDLHINRKTTLKLQVYRQTVAAYVNGREMIRGRPLMEWYERPERELVGLTVNARGDVSDPVLFRTVKIRGLTQPPAGWIAPNIVRTVPTGRGWAGQASTQDEALQH